MPRRDDDRPTPCSLCGRAMPSRLLTEHHLLPKQKGGGPEHKVPMCRPCHGHVHATYDNGTLAAAFASLDQLRRAEPLQRFVKFIRKQPPTAAVRSRLIAERRRHR